MRFKVAGYIYNLRNLFIKRRIYSGIGGLILPIINTHRKPYKLGKIPILPFKYSFSEVFTSFRLSIPIKLLLLVLVFLSFLLNSVTLICSSFLLNIEFLILTSLAKTQSYSLNESSTDKPSGVILARVSTQKQAKEGESLPSQIRELSKLSEDYGITIVNTFRESGQSTKDLDKNLLRDPIWGILDLAKSGKIKYLLVLDIHRVGRNKLWTIGFSVILCLLGVNILTPEREYDLQNLPDLLLFIVKSCAAEEEGKDIGRRCKSGKLSNFEKRKNWVKGSADFGYELRPASNGKANGKWPVKDENYSDIIKDIFRLFKQFKSFRKVSKQIKSKHNVKLKPDKIKRILRNPIYCGKPQYGRVVVEDNSLAFVDKETFDEVQDMLAESKTRKSGEKHRESLREAEDILELYGYLNGKKLLPEVAYVCPECRVEMNYNGNKRKRGKPIPFFECPECGYQHVDPLWKNRNNLKNTIYFICECGNLENFEVEKTSDSEWSYRCPNCGLRYVTNTPPNPYERFFKAKRDTLEVFKETEKIASLDEFFN